MFVDDVEQRFSDGRAYTTLCWANTEGLHLDRMEHMLPRPHTCRLSITCYTRTEALERLPTLTWATWL